MADEGGRTELRRRQLEATRAEVVAHVATLPREKRRDMQITVDGTLARIDAEIERLGASEAGDGRPSC